MNQMTTAFLVRVTRAGNLVRQDLVLSDLDLRKASPSYSSSVAKGKAGGLKGIGGSRGSTRPRGYRGHESVMTDTAHESLGQFDSSAFHLRDSCRWPT
jgi:hypothetical protein